MTLPCGELHKKPYSTQKEAELAADRVAFVEWCKGVDKAMRVYPCHAHFHVGTAMERKVIPGLKPLHLYLHRPTPPPMPVDPLCDPEGLRPEFIEGLGRAMAGRPDGEVLLDRLVVAFREARRGREIELLLARARDVSA